MASEQLKDAGPILVTGVSGFVGSAVARVIADAGGAVRGMARSTSAPANLAGFAGDLVEGDLRDAAAVGRAMAGIRHVFHVAADYRLWARDPEEIVRNNRDTTRIVMEAALAVGVERIVYTSSVATLLPDAGDETGAAREDQVVGAYKRSKVVAERLVERMVAEQGLPAVIVNPSTPIGPRDVRPTPTGRIIVEAANGRMPAYVDSGLNLVHVDDVAAGHLAALTSGRIGERYILGGEDVTLAAMLRAIAVLVGRSPPTVALPRGPLFPLAWLNEQLARVTGKEPFLTLDGLRMAKHRMFYSSAKAQAELGYRARPYGEALADAIAWFREAGDDPVIAIGALALVIWVGLLLGNGGFWLTRERDDADVPGEPATWPDIVAVVPARDEAELIARSIGSLAAQDYPGSFRIVLVDDSSSDGTAAIARAAAGPERLTIHPGRPLAPGWTGKLWAVEQGIAAAGTPAYLWLTDADIAHAPDTLRSLVARAGARDLVLVSLMAKLRCDTLAERALVPAFVFFFQMLYPFGRVNRPGGVGAAAGGCMLVRRDALDRAGGIAAIRGALIDDCAFGALLKQQGPIWLGLTDRSRSIRPYEGFGAVAAMISRSAYAQLGYRPFALIGTLLGLGIVYVVPPVLAIGGVGAARALGIAAWASMAVAFQPMLRFYRRSPLWGVALPGIAAFYAGCTLLSAWQHKQGRGGMWKGRAQAAAGR